MKWILATLMLTTLAFACPPKPTPVQPTTTISNSNVNQNSNTNTVTSTSKANSTSTASSVSNSSSQASGGTANATGGTSSASTGAQSNSQVTNDNQPRQAPPATAPLILPTANCLGGISGGASAPVGGISFGSTKVDKECRMQALANEFIGMGNFEAAAKVLCATKSAKTADLTMNDCRLAVKPEPVPVPIVVQPVPLPPSPTIILYESIDVVPTVEDKKEAAAIAKPAVKKPVHRKPCVPSSLMIPMEK